jgi:hypothetical protein
MSKVHRLILATATALLLVLTTCQLTAQDNQSGGRPRQGNGQGGGRQRPGNFDPAQFQQRMMERYRERLELTDDQEWKAVQPLIQKVMDARAAIGAGGRGPFGRGGRAGGGGNQADQVQRRNPVAPNPAVEGLQQAIDNKAPASEVKAALAKYLEYRKDKRAELEKAQEGLRGVLTSRQEAIAVLIGLL